MATIGLEMVLIAKRMMMTEMLKTNPGMMWTMAVNRTRITTIGGMMVGKAGKAVGVVLQIGKRQRGAERF